MHFSIDVIVHLNVKGMDHIHDLLHQLLTQGEKTMTAISDFAAKQTVHNDRMDTAIAGLSADVAGLKDLIAQLQASPGPITAEDQALLDAMDARAEVISAKLEALDGMTPPVVPPVPA